MNDKLEVFAKSLWHCLPYDHATGTVNCPSLLDATQSVREALKRTGLTIIEVPTREPEQPDEHPGLDPFDDQERDHRSGSTLHPSRLTP